MQKRIFRSKSTIYHLPPTNAGFSLVELIIVIAIIAIIATLGLASYNVEIQNSTSSSLQSGLKNASKQLVVDQIRSSTGVYPATLAAANSGAGISFSSGTTVAYNVDNTDTPKTFCLSATQRVQSYFITQEGTPLPGPCPVLYLDAGIQNSYSGTGMAWGDLSGLGNNGTLYNGVTYSSTGSGSLSFSGANDYINTGNNSSLMPTSNVTVTAWIKTSAIGNYRTVLSKGYDATDGGFAMRITRDSEPINLFFQVYNTTGTLASAGAYNDIANGNWYYAVGTYDGSNVRLFVNGVQIGSAAPLTGNIKSNVLPVKIGVASTASAVTEYYSGQISEIRIYNSAFGTTDITNSFNALRSRYGL